ncbi:MAG: acyl-[ACP]--phospholipid O-acyltransferase [Acidobacteria bacterium]|jgi:acyl-[acyl-carrier-protein]-phospholipid O-acyltransferase/long-chain-fatty-acid--[acyl-carrier-protein] ligase|nr:MAG: acyl-[ACP]--phospholipid O-acyltransferase [Acidobacteriota bacterium]
MPADETFSVPAPEKKWQLGFWSLIATQFQGAFNENALKFLVIYLILAIEEDKAQRDQMELLVGVLFAAPFILFSLVGGYFADRFSKRTVTIWTKVFEVGVMLFAAASLVGPNLNLALAAIFLVCTQGALFGPSKYGLLPELLPPEKLSWGNGVLELGTFLAIIVGSMSGSFLAEAFNGREIYAGALLLGFTVIGLVWSFGIGRVPAADPAKRFHLVSLIDVWSPMKLIRSDRVLWLAVLGNTYFFFVAGLLQFNIFIYGQDVLHIRSTEGGFLQAAIAIGIGLGSFAAGYLSAGKIEYGLIPLGSMGMTVLGLCLAIPHLSFRAVLLLLAALGFFGGFFIVPVSASIQHRPEEDKKGVVIGTANWLSFVGIGAASGVYYFATHFLHLGPGEIFFWSALATLGATGYVLRLLPDSLLRLFLWIATHTLYRLDVVGRENVPARGGALLTPNHASMADAVLLIASIDRPIRFIMFKGSYEHPLVKPFAKIMGVIPIASDQGPREMIHSLRMATDALKSGEVVCIFPEGQMTRIGQMLPFRRGMERIIKGVDVPIIPVNLDGVWGSIFSFAGGRFLWKFPRRIPYPVRVTFGKPMPPTSTSMEVRRAVQDLGAEAFARRKKRMHALWQSFIYTARRHPFRFAMADGQRPRLNYFQALAGALVLARRLRKLWQGQEMVGVLLPPSVPGALVNFAAILMGKVPVNLNYTISNETLASCAQQCNLKTIVTARVFLEKVKIQPPGEIIFIEDVAKDAEFGERLSAALAASLLPSKWVAKFAGCERPATLDDIATIIFSSGSTGDPKGVMLTHYNIASNVAQLSQVFMLHADDRIMGILPFFHSFGFTGTLCLPAATGIGVVFHPNPLDSRVIGALVNKYAVTMLLATPTFLNAYTRRCTPEEFGSLRFVMAGAEKLPDRISQAFEDHFGIRPHEGYGCTECSPAVTVNTIDFRAASFRQVGAKRGSIGHPLPGMTVKIVDPDTMQPVGVDEPGLLLVRGPNIMQGYLNKPEKTADVLRDGWYNTGDIARLDEDGFLKITDRLSRFSKIGGEMVPHIKVEDLLQELAGASEQTFVVTAIPDEKKGERLIVLHTLAEPQLEACLEKLGKSDLPALWRLRPDQFVRIEKLPYLGTGKLDLRKARELALEMGQRALRE